MGDADALFARHQQQVFRFLCRMVGQSDDARDLTQDVFVRMSRTQVPVRDGTQARAWLFRVARNLAIDHIRSRRRRPEDPLTLAEDIGRAATQDIRMDVRRALATLDDLDRDVFLMREVGGLGYDEIAAACDITRDAARCRIHRARQALRTMLGEGLSDRAVPQVRLPPPTNG